MKTPDMNDIRRELRTRYAAPEPPPAAAFWAEANARLNLELQERMRRARLTRAQFRMVWTATAAAAGFMFVLSLTWLNPRPDAAVAGPAPAVQSLDVRVGHRGVLMLEGNRHKGTVVFVSGIQNDSEPVPASVH